MGAAPANPGGGNSHRNGRNATPPARSKRPTSRPGTAERSRWETLRSMRPTVAGFRVRPRGKVIRQGFGQWVAHSANAMRTRASSSQSAASGSWDRASSCRTSSHGNGGG